MTNSPRFSNGISPGDPANGIANFVTQRPVGVAPASTGVRISKHVSRNVCIKLAQTTDVCSRVGTALVRTEGSLNSLALLSRICNSAALMKNHEKNDATTSLNYDFTI